MSYYSRPQMQSIAVYIIEHVVKGIDVIIQFIVNTTIFDFLETCT